MCWLLLAEAPPDPHVALVSSVDLNGRVHGECPLCCEDPAVACSASDGHWLMRRSQSGM
jgi:hypothetical protein